MLQCTFISIILFILAIQDYWLDRLLERPMIFKWNYQHWYSLKRISVTVCSQQTSTQPASSVLTLLCLLSLSMFDVKNCPITDKPASLESTKNSSALAPWRHHCVAARQSDGASLYRKNICNQILCTLPIAASSSLPPAFLVRIGVCKKCVAYFTL